MSTTTNASDDLPGDYKAAIAGAISVATFAMLITLIRCLRSLKEQEEEEVVAGGGGRSTVEMARRPEGPLVCTYRRADGWREATCGVCLSELADGELLRVLPACMHYFHVACVDEWLRLRARATCPLCRAPAGQPSPPQPQPQPQPQQQQTRYDMSSWMLNVQRLV